MFAIDTASLMDSAATSRMNGDTVYRLLLNVSALAVLGWVAVDAVRGPVDDPPPPTSAYSTDGTAAGDAQDQAGVEEIVATHLFGQPEQSAAEAYSRVPPSPLDLRLMGVVDSTDRQQARALIGVGSAPARYFAVNQLIAGSDARIRAIGADQVVIERGGQLERVLLWSPENMARANEGAQAPPLPGVAAPAYPDLNSIDRPPGATLLPIPSRQGAASDTP